MHIFIWGSILSWLVVIPITSTEGLYGIIGFFEYAGVAFEILSSATFWFYLPVTVAVALAPTIAFRIMRLDVNPHTIDDVRLLQHQEGRRLFKRLKFHRKPPASAVSRRSVKRTGYAYSHTEGYGKMITTGHIFGMNEEEVLAERHRRISTIVSHPGSRATSPGKDSLSAIGSTLVAAGVEAAVMVASHRIVEEEHDDVSQKTAVEIHKVVVEVEKTETERSHQDQQSPIVDEENVKVDLTDKEDEREGTSPEEITSDHDSSRALLLPEKTYIAGDEGEPIETNLIEVKENDDWPQISINLPGSVESPPSNVEEEEEGASDDQKVLV